MAISDEESDVFPLGRQETVMKFDPGGRDFTTVAGTVNNVTPNLRCAQIVDLIEALIRLEVNDPNGVIQSYADVTAGGVHMGTMRGDQINATITQYLKELIDHRSKVFATGASRTLESLTSDIRQMERQLARSLPEITKEADQPELPKGSFYAEGYFLLWCKVHGQKFLMYFDPQPDLTAYENHLCLKVADGRIMGNVHAFMIDKKIDRHFKMVVRNGRFVDEGAILPHPILPPRGSESRAYYPDLPMVVETAEKELGSFKTTGSVNLDLIEQARQAGTAQQMLMDAEAAAMVMGLDVPQ